MSTDFVIRDHGTIVTFTPISEAALEFMRDVDSEPWQWLGPTLCVDHRMAQPLVDAIAHDFTISRE